MGEKYDDASWHYGGDFPENLPEQAARTHIGMFVAWAVLGGLGSDELCSEDPDGPNFVAQLRQRTITPGAFIFMLDGKFTNEELNDEGNAFASAYYDMENGRYGEDYETTVVGDAPDLYSVEDSWTTFDQLKPVLDRRLAEWRASR